jgi:spermidine/putrescine transport system permease protein
MTNLTKVYGRTFTLASWLLVATWLLLLILAPMVLMVEQSLWRLETPKDAATLTQRIDQLYNDLSVVKLDRQSASSDTAAQLDNKIAALESELRSLEARETKPQRVYGVANYTRMTGAHLEIFITTILHASIVTALALAVCYPVAWVAARTLRPWLAALLLLGLTIPYATNELIRVYAWLMILDVRGILNRALEYVGLISLEQNPIRFLESKGAIFAGLVYTYILFMAFPLYNAFQSLDRAQVDAARDLGAGVFQTHWRVVIPHAKPGIAIGCITVFMLAAGSWSVPQTLSRGLGGDWFTTLIYRQFFESHNWNIGSAYAVVLLVICLVFIALVLRSTGVTLRDMMR